MNREFLQLAQTYDPKKHGLAGQYLSEKLDGCRAYWDGGISRGLIASSVPWANTSKDKEETTATGLWSRYGKPIQAPAYWLDCLPSFPLDGELWIQRKSFQQLMSITRRTVNIDETGWMSVKFMVFDSPTYEQVFMPGMINNVNYKMDVGPDVLKWVRSRLLIEAPIRGGFRGTYDLLCSELEGNKVVVIHKQLQLPFKTLAAKEKTEELLLEVSAGGGEGLMLRHPSMEWYPKRVNTLLKIKPLHDMEAVVVGWLPGKGKYLGLMGSLSVRMVNGKTFDLSGFTDAERVLSDDGSRVVAFPVGSVVTFLYRELTNDGYPKEARYFRRVTCAM